MLVAAKAAHAAVGLSLPRGASPAPGSTRWSGRRTSWPRPCRSSSPGWWSLEGATPPAVERALQDCWRLVDAGLTHVAFDASALAPAERARALLAVAVPVEERGLAFDCVLAIDEPGAARSAVALVAELARGGLRPDLVSVRCPAPAAEVAARAQGGGAGAPWPRRWAACR